jgi:TonB-linked SusC/RagA family outer membrane protein
MKHVILVVALLIFAASSAMAQKTISGNVSDSSEPLIGANVVVKNSTIGTTTDFDGNFTLEVPNDATELEVSYTGYTTKVVSIVGQSTINIVLTQGVDIDEVVVIAYGVQKKEELTGSVSVVKASEIEQIPIPTFDQILQGKAAGLQILGGSGQPGSSAGKVLIRGTGSISSSNDPLYILDGVRIDGGVFATLNPNDFESVSVLKDASAASLYGAQAANGVIIITSKKGKKGSPTRVTYRTQYGVSGRTQEKFGMMNASEKLALEKKAGEAGVPRGVASPGYRYGSTESSEYNQAVYDSLSRLNIDWRDFFFLQNKTQSHEILATGGSENTSFYVAAQYLNQEGQTIRSGLKRGTLRMNLDHKANDKLTFGLSSSTGYSRRNFVESENSVSLSNPFAAVYLANGYESPYLPGGAYNLTGLSNSVNVLELTNNSTNSRDEMKIVGSLFAEYQIIDGLKARISNGLDFTQQTTERWIDPLSVRGMSSSVRGFQGSFAQSYLRQTQWNGSATLNYIKYINDLHKIDFLAGTELVNRKLTSFSFTGFGLNELLPETAAGITAGTTSNGFIPTVGGGNNANSMLSFFGRANYGFDQRYNISASLRRDASSRFGANNKWGTFWDVGASWVLSEESFMNSVDFVDFLKLSVSYGSLGNERLLVGGTEAYYEPQGTYSAITTYQGAGGLGLSRIPNPDLKWETTSMTNIGLEFELLKKRIGGKIEVYNNITKDLFVNQTLSPAASGNAGSKLINAGKMRNRGVELSLDYQLFKSQDFGWGVSGNVGYNENEILDLGQVEEYELGTGIIKEGLSLGTHYVVGWAGVDPATGVPLYYDINGNVTSVFSEDNSNYIYGSEAIPWVGGFGTEVTYKGFGIQASFSFVQGNTLFNNQTFFIENHNFLQYNQSTIMNSAWTKPGDITEIQGFIDPATGSSTVRQFSSKDLEDGSFIRFRNLTVSYTLPNSILGGALNKVRIYGQAQNLFTWTKFTGFDPEISNNIAQFEYPAARTFTVGLDVGF